MTANVKESDEEEDLGMWQDSSGEMVIWNEFSSNLEPLC